MTQETQTLIVSIVLPSLVAGIGWLIRNSYKDAKERKFRQDQTDKFQKESIETDAKLEKDLSVVTALAVGLQTKFEFLSDAVSEQRLSGKRLELLNVMQHSPQNSRLICQLYDEYKAAGGNSYISRLFEEWKNDAESEQN